MPGAEIEETDDLGNVKYSNKSLDRFVLPLLRSLNLGVRERFPSVLGYKLTIFIAFRVHSVENFTPDTDSKQNRSRIYYTN
jgi:hypothetical protein